MLNYFKAYNEEFVSSIIIEILARVNSSECELNLKAVLSVLFNGKYAHIKKRDNIRLMHKLSLAGAKVLAEEIANL